MKECVYCRDARDLADYILLKAAKNGHYLTPLQVNKLCYLTHGFVLRNTGHRAFHNDVEAWQYGPVIPEVYDAFQEYGRRPIRRLWGSGKRICIGNVDDAIKTLAKEINGDVKNIVDEVVDRYADVDGGRLIGMTHEEDTPWHQTRKWFRTPITPTDIIQTYYKNMGPDTVGR